MKRFMLLFLSMLFFFCTVSAQGTQFKTLVIDAGHGGKDPGCHGKYVHEKDIALSVAKELERIVKENLKEVRVIMTRKSDHFVELHERANIANRNKADLFVSIHCNASPNKSAYGTETYAMGLHVSDKNARVASRENQVILKEENYLEKYDGFDPTSPEASIIFSLFQNAYLENSVNFADKIENQFKFRVNRKSRGVKQAGFLVLWKTSGPSVLIEIGYLTNAKEESYLKRKSNQTLIASGIYRAIKSYIGDIEMLSNQQ